MLGSVFLGDRPHLRFLPNSPPPSPSTATWMSPTLSLQLRIRWLEALLIGVRQEVALKGKKAEEKGKKSEVRKVERGVNRKKTGEDDSQSEEEEVYSSEDNARDVEDDTEGDVEDVEGVHTLLRQAEDVQLQLQGVVDANEAIRKFMDTYDKYAHLLTTSFAFSQAHTSAPEYSGLSSSELDAFLTEMESDIRNADRDLRDIETLDKKGVTAAGRLEEHESLQPRLDKLVRASKEDVAMYITLERRIARLLERYTSQVDAMSELFVAWNEVITEAEDQVSRLEREREAEKKLAFEEEYLEKEVPLGEDSLEKEAPLGEEGLEKEVPLGEGELEREVTVGEGDSENKHDPGEEDSEKELAPGEEE